METKEPKALKLPNGYLIKEVSDTVTEDILNKSVRNFIRNIAKNKEEFDEDIEKMIVEGDEYDEFYYDTDKEKYEYHIDINRQSGTELEATISIWDISENLAGDDTVILYELTRKIHLVPLFR